MTNQNITIIKSEQEFGQARTRLDAITRKGCDLGDMELLPDADKAEYTRLAHAIHEWEKTYHPLPNRISPALVQSIQAKMAEKGMKQREAAQALGIPENRMSEVLKGRRAMTLHFIKQLVNVFDIPADFIIKHI